VLLAGDIGGTNARMALFSKKEGIKCSLFEDVYPAKDFDSIEDLILHFLDNHKVEVSAATFVVAGPEEDGSIQGTNLPWLVEKEDVIKVLGGIPVVLFNDMVGISNIIQVLQPSQLETLNEGKHANQEPIAVIAPGTGLGEAYLIWDGDDYRTLPSEGGHADFGPTTELQREILNYIARNTTMLAMREYVLVQAF